MQLQCCEIYLSMMVSKLSHEIGLTFQECFVGGFKTGGTCDYKCSPFPSIHVLVLCKVRIIKPIAPPRIRLLKVSFIRNRASPLALLRSPEHLHLKLCDKTRNDGCKSIVRMFEKQRFCSALQSTPRASHNDPEPRFWAIFR